MRGTIPCLFTTPILKSLVPNSPSNDWTAPANKMYAAMRTRGWQAFKADEFKMQVQTSKENKQEKNAV